MSDQSNGSQGQLFSDAAVGAPSYDEVDTDLVVARRADSGVAEELTLGAGALVAHVGVLLWSRSARAGRVDGSTCLGIAPTEPQVSHRCGSPTVSRAMESVN